MRYFILILFILNFGSCYSMAETISISGKLICNEGYFTLPEGTYTPFSINNELRYTAAFLLNDEQQILLIGYDPATDGEFKVLKKDKKMAQVFSITADWVGESLLYGDTLMLSVQKNDDWYIQVYSIRISKLLFEKKISTPYWSYNQIKQDVLYTVKGKSYKLNLQTKQAVICEYSFGRAFFMNEQISFITKKGIYINGKLIKIKGIPEAIGTPKYFHLEQKLLYTSLGKSVLAGGCKDCLDLVIINLDNNSFNVWSPATRETNSMGMEMTSWIWIPK